MSDCSTPVRGIDPREYDVFIGMDVDKRSIALTHVDHLGLEKSVKMPHESETVLSFVRNHFSGKRAAFVYEAGPTALVYMTTLPPLDMIVLLFLRHQCRRLAASE